MFEFSSSLSRLAAMELISILTEDDFFFVVTVNDREGTGPIGGCFSNKTRASPENKVTVSHIIQSTKQSRGTTDFDYGLELALNNLQVDSYKSN